MYDLVDRPLSVLAPGSRLLLASMRRWVQAMGDRHCPSSAVAPALLATGALEALPPLGRFMVLLNTQATDAVAFAPFGCGCIAESEAILLRLASDAMADPPAARATLAMLVADEAAEPAFVALIDLVGRLAARGLPPVGRLPADVAG